MRLWQLWKSKEFYVGILRMSSFGANVELNPIIGERIKRRKKKEYERRLKTVPCAIDAKLPHSYHLKSNGVVVRRVNLKKKMMERMLAKHQKRENEILDRRMTSASKSQVDSQLEAKYRHFTTVNGPARKKYAKWLKVDNKHFQRRLKETPATYTRKEWAKWRAKTNGAILCNPYTARRMNRQKEVDVDNAHGNSRISSVPANYDLDKFNNEYLVQLELREANPYTAKRMKAYKEIRHGNKVNMERMAKAVETPNLTPRKWAKDRKHLTCTEETNPYTARRRHRDKNLKVDNYHYNRRMKDQGPFYVVKDWLKEREEIEKRIVYTCTLNVGRKGWAVAPLVKREKEEKTPDDVETIVKKSAASFNHILYPDRKYRRHVGGSKSHTLPLPHTQNEMITFHADEFPVAVNEIPSSSPSTPTIPSEGSTTKIFTPHQPKTPAPTHSFRTARVLKGTCLMDPSIADDETST
jgi:hypothetical protein